MMVWSSHDPRLTAAKTPAGTPIATAIRIAKSDSSTVAGNSVMNSVRTGRRVTIDVPKSPAKRPVR